jgi:hypothetical protein
MSETAAGKDPGSSQTSDNCSALAENREACFPRWVTSLRVKSKSSLQEKHQAGFTAEKESHSAREPARKVKTKDVVRNKSLIRLVVSLPGSTVHILMPFNCSTVSFQNRWSGSRE